MAIKKKNISPRQKMINLMYVVLMAMLALNVSSEVLDSFTLIEQSMRRTTQSASKENQMIYDRFDEQQNFNPTKTREWYNKAQEVRRVSDSLYIFAETLKFAIAKEADGENADIDNIKNREDLEAAAQVMLAPTKGQGRKLYEAINAYREKMVEMMNDSLKKEVIEENLSTSVPKTALGKRWEEYMFESKPTVAAMTVLTKLQNDIRYAEGEVLHSLMANIDEKDMRVNSLKAFVITNAQTIVRGNHFRANIIMAAVDTTHIPEVYIAGRKTELHNGIYDIVCNKSGSYSLTGWLQTTTNNGEILKREFSQIYSVVEPTATVSADLMNVLYAGYDNPISVSVPGVPLTTVTAAVTGGTLSQTAPGQYKVRPSKIGHDVTITVFSAGQQMAQHIFKVRKLPEPTPYIDIKDDKGNPDRFKGGALQKTKLLAVTHIGAAVDDGILNIPFKVLSFEMVVFDNMGNAVPVTSEGASFSSQQKEMLKRLSRNKRAYISHIRATGPDGIVRKLNSSMEIILK